VGRSNEKSIDVTWTAGGTGGLEPVGA
jgi:hypothetical protein